MMIKCVKKKIIFITKSFSIHSNSTSSLSMSSIEQASSVARAAVQLDREGAAGDAAELYGQAARQLHQILQDPSLSDDKRRSLAATQAAYVARAEALRHGGAATAATAPVNSAQRDHDEGTCAAVVAFDWLPVAVPPYPRPLAAGSARPEGPETFTLVSPLTPPPKLICAFSL